MKAFRTAKSYPFGLTLFLKYKSNVCYFLCSYSLSVTNFHLVMFVNPSIMPWRVHAIHTWIILYLRYWIFLGRQFSSSRFHLASTIHLKNHSEIRNNLNDMATFVRAILRWASIKVCVIFRHPYKCAMYTRNIEWSNFGCEALKQFLV